MSNTDFKNWTSGNYGDQRTVVVNEAKIKSEREEIRPGKSGNVNLSNEELAKILEEKRAREKKNN
eukprot:CAMPEP_0116916884 /NCGR_PEP_ID=MMETSP0467-20121206/18802_1 /TAXON_ID=283647 /ORGANISM="Mesodinium pulex, Strain SPMC105" /LENGTH=64 /DNA_ID=CAMNT_0004593849 /DNA_START=268 /DNA_END=461 /DNA_ORIENTATION=+